VLYLLCPFDPHPSVAGCVIVGDMKKELSHPFFIASFLLLDWHTVMGLECFICQTVLEDDRPSRLVRHAEQMHADQMVDFTCNQPGCGGARVGIVPAVMAIGHYCWHLSPRDVHGSAVQESSDSDTLDQFVGNAQALEAYFQAEEEQNPVGDLLDAWLLDDETETSEGQEIDFSVPPRKLTAEEAVHMEFLTFCVKHSLTQQAHQDLFQTQLMKNVFPDFPKPETLKRQAWKYLEDAGLGVSDLRTHTRNLSPSSTFARASEPGSSTRTSPRF
jgi:hypothetical protein